MKANFRQSLCYRGISHVYLFPFTKKKKIVENRKVSLRESIPSPQNITETLPVKFYMDILIGFIKKREKEREVDR